MTTYLKPNDRIALFCTGSRAINPNDPKDAQADLKNHLQLNAIYKEDTYKTLPAETRAQIFLDYLFDDSIDALWALRGGEGSADVIPFLEKEKDRIAKLKPKLIIGFSDITAVLVYFSQTFGWPVIHGPGAHQTTSSHLDEQSKKISCDYLFGKTGQITLTDLEPLNEAAKSTTTEIQAEITGGNLSLLNISVKDTWELNCKDKIIIIEDVNEAPHAVFRTLKYLKRIEIFDQAKAMILGEFSDNPAQEQATKTLLQYFAETCDFPILKSNRFGHFKRNVPIPFAKACLNLKNQSLTC